MAIMLKMMLAEVVSIIGIVNRMRAPMVAVVISTFLF